MKPSLVLLGILICASGAWAQTLSEEHLTYVTQVVAQNAQKTNAKLVTLHIKVIKTATTADLTDLQRESDFDRSKEHTVISGETKDQGYRILTDDSRVEKLQVGKDYSVVVGMASLDFKKHRYNVKDRNSAVILIENGKKEPFQFEGTVVEVLEK